MFLRRSPLTVRNVKLIKFIQLAFTRQENVVHWLKANVTTSGRRKGMVGRSIRFNMNLPKPLKSKLCGLNVKNAVTCAIKMAYVSENLP